MTPIALTTKACRREASSKDLLIAAVISGSFKWSWCCHFGSIRQLYHCILLLIRLRSLAEARRSKTSSQTHKKDVVSTFHYHFMDFVCLEWSTNIFMFAGDHNHLVSTLCQLHWWRNPGSTGRFRFRMMKYNWVRWFSNILQELWWSCCIVFCTWVDQDQNLHWRPFNEVMTFRTCLNNHIFATVMYGLHVFPDSQDNVVNLHVSLLFSRSSLKD